MAICLDIHFKHDFAGCGNYDSCVEYLNQTAEKLRKAFNLTEDQVSVYALYGGEQENEDEAHYDSWRYGIRNDEPLWIDCHLEDGFWVISTCEPNSALFDAECNTLEFVKQIIRIFGVHTAYVTEEIASWLEYASPDMSLDEWLQKIQYPYIVEL